MPKWFVRNALYIAWFQSLLATLSSLYLSEFVHFPPCVLCWYQRVCMYPLAVIILVSILRKDKNVGMLVLPFSLVGMAIALFHSLLQWKIIPDAIAPCAQGVSCTTVQVSWLGFITIPFLSFVAFAIITFCVIAYHKFVLTHDKRN